MASSSENPGGSVALSLVYGVGMASVFTGERLIGSGSWRWLSAAGVALILVATAMRLLRARNTTAEAKYVETVLARFYGVGILALLLYFAQSDLWTHVAGTPLSKSSPKLSTALAALWPALWLAGALPGLFVELAYSVVRVSDVDASGVRGLAGGIAVLVAKAVRTVVEETDLVGGTRPPKIELMRIRDAMYSGLGLTGALVFAFTVAYVANERDKKVDLSYFRTAKAGEATKKIVASFDAPVEVALFFPPGNEVREQVQDYFKEIGSANLQVKEYDHAVDPGKAKELGVSGNGTVALKKGGRKELLSVGLELESARTQLANLDKEVQKRLLQVGKAARNLYLTNGHGERTELPQGDTDKRLTVRDLKELLQQQGNTVRGLGAAEGLAADVPPDAAAVLILGPTKPFLPEEIAAIGRYLDKNGRVFLALDPEAGEMKELLSLVALRHLPTQLANDQIFARRTYQASDKSNIATGSYSSHPSVTTIGRLGMKAPMVLLGAGALEEIPAKDRAADKKDLSIDFTVRSHVATWNDKDGNFSFDGPAGETRKAWQVAAAVVRKKASNKPADETRALVLADSDAIADGVLGNPGNAYYALDGLKWLLGDEAIAGEVSSEVDQPVAHTRKQDVVWFYGTIFIAPLAVLGAGAAVTSRRRRSKKEKTK